MTFSICALLICPKLSAVRTLGLFSRSLYTRKGSTAWVGASPHQHRLVEIIVFLRRQGVFFDKEITGTRSGSRWKCRCSLDSGKTRCKRNEEGSVKMREGDNFKALYSVKSVLIYLNCRITTADIIMYICSHPRKCPCHLTTAQFLALPESPILSSTSNVILCVVVDVPLRCAEYISRLIVWPALATFPKDWSEYRLCISQLLVDLEHC